MKRFFSTISFGFIFFLTFISLCLAGSIDLEKLLIKSSDEIQKAVITTASPDWSSGAISIVDVNTLNATNDLLPSESDITVCAYDRYFYKIGRKDIDTIAKFDITDLSHPLWECSTMDDNDTVSSSNPYGVVFASSTKAYLLRYDTDTAWIINPSAKNCAALKTGILDLSAYDDGDGSPEMVSGVVVNNKLFIVLQRLDRDLGWEPLDAYVAVFDTTTDEEIDTGKGDFGLKGIKLPIKNPGHIQYVDGKIYIQGVGKYGFPSWGIPAEYSGGIVRIDPETYDCEMVVDDGNDTDHPYGNISGLIVVNATKGYFVGYEDWGDNTLYAFNPSTGEVLGPIPGLTHTNITGMESGGAVDIYNRAWITTYNSTQSGIALLNTQNDTIEAFIDTDMNPQKVVFVTYSEENNTANNIPETESKGGGGCSINTHNSFDLMWIVMLLVPFLISLKRKNFSI